MKLSPEMFVFHSAYTYEQMLETGLKVFVSARDASDMFKLIVTISPVASLQYPNDSIKRFTKPIIEYLDKKNALIEGKIGMSPKLENFPRLNFVLAQCELLRFLTKSINFRAIKVIRAEDPRLNGLYALTLSRILGVPLIVGVWGNSDRIRKLTGVPIMPRLFLRCAIEERVERFVLRRADFVLAQNSENLNSAIANGARSDRSALTELGVGIDAAHFFPPESRKSASLQFEEWECFGKTTLICVSRLEKLKMVDHAILSVKLLKEMKITFRLIIVGTGREERYLKELAKENSLQEEIIFAGQRSQDWISSALAMSDIFVSPLCGRSLLEAGLAGIPAVGYDVDWHDQIITENTGLLVENLNSPKLAEAICKLALQKDLALELGSNMRFHSLSLANPKSIALKQREIYARLIEN